MRDKSLFFLVLALICFWLVMNEFYGSRLITQFITTLIPKAQED